MANPKKNENFMSQGEGTEFGYFEKRRQKFNESLKAGFEGNKAKFIKPKPRKTNEKDTL